MLAKGDKKRALLALRRKKYQESLLAKTDAQLEQLEQLTSNVEFAQIQKDVVFGLQQGTKVLQEIHAEMGGIEHVEKLMGDTADAIAYQQVCFFSYLRSQPAELVGILIKSLQTGNQRHAWRPNLKSRRGRSRGRARSIGAGDSGVQGTKAAYSSKLTTARTTGGRGCAGRGSDGKTGYAGVIVVTDEQAFWVAGGVVTVYMHIGWVFTIYTAQVSHFRIHYIILFLTD